MSVEHRNIPEDGLHEPKGASLQPANRVYISDGNGSGSWASVNANTLKGVINDTLPAGRVLITDGDGGGITTQSGPSFGTMAITTNNTAFAIGAATDASFNTTSDYELFTGTGAPWASESLDGISFSSDRLTVSAAGTYKIDFWAQVKQFASNGSSVAVRYRVNGGAFSSRFPVATSNANGDTKQLLGFGHLELGVGDYVQIYLASSAAGNIILSNVNTSLFLLKAT